MISYLWMAILFFILSPGILINIPPIGKFEWASGKTSIQSAFVHAILFGCILYGFNRYQEDFGAVSTFYSQQKKPFRPPFNQADV